MLTPGMGFVFSSKCESYEKYDNLMIFVLGVRDEKCCDSAGAYVTYIRIINGVRDNSRTNTKIEFWNLYISMHDFAMG